MSSREKGKAISKREKGKLLRDKGKRENFYGTKGKGKSKRTTFEAHFH